jgi:hypothetical protein
MGPSRGENYFQLEILGAIDGLHEFEHFRAFGVGMLPELSGDGDGVHGDGSTRRLEIITNVEN